MNLYSFSKSLKLPEDHDFSKRLFKLPKIPSIRVDNVDEYFALPKKEREWKGFYRMPYALPWELIGDEERGWDAFYTEIKKQYPIQYFFRHWLLSLDNPLVFAVKKHLQWPLRDIKWAIQNFIKPCFPRWRRVLPRHKYGDITYIMIESNFALICDFYHEEVVDGLVDWSDNDVHKKFYTELVAAVNWIETERKKVDGLIDEALTKAIGNKIKVDGKFDYKSTYADHDRLEKHKLEKETEILKWFIDNREFFWT